MLSNKSAVAIGVIVFLGSVVLAFRSGQELAEMRHLQETWRAESRFAQIGVLLFNYHNDHGSYPPTKYQDHPGAPKHSWRVLLSRYISEQLYEKFDVSEEWNSPNNVAVAEELKSQTGLFSMDGESRDVAHYIAIGEGEEWPTFPPKHKPLRAVLHGIGNDRFLLVEYPASAVSLTEPRY